MSRSEIPFWEAVDRIRAANPRYRREAYGFVMEALGVTVRALPAGRRENPERRHLSGRELLAGVITLARREFGVMAPTVFHEWGVLSSADLGEIVFELVECGQLSARPEDRREDFAGADLLRSLTEGLELFMPGAGGEPPSGRRRLSGSEPGAAV
jgi:uncharacterized repeat protein (TIGR04138 family)